MRIRPPRGFGVVSVTLRRGAFSMFRSDATVPPLRPPLNLK